MPTFLTNPKMSAALARRVHDSVRGRRPGRVRAAIRLAPILRAAGVLGAIGLIALLVVTRRHTEQRFEAERAALLAAVDKESASLTADDKTSVTRIESWLLRLSMAYDTDLIAAELRAPGAITALLARPAVYVRGPIGSFTRAAEIPEAAAASGKDALVLCLLDPPASRSEKLLLGKAKTAFAAGANLEQRTASVRRLHEANAGLPMLLPPWSDRVRAATEARELVALRTELERAPLQRAKQAAKAELLIAAMDEPGRGISELDGERPHDVRVTFVDLALAKVVLRVRRHVDPSRWTDVARTEHAGGLDSCALALDVLDSIAK